MFLKCVSKRNNRNNMHGATIKKKPLNSCIHVWTLLTCWSQKVVTIAVAQHCVRQCQTGIACSPDKNTLSRIMIPLCSLVVAYVLITCSELNLNLPSPQVTIFLVIN